MPIRVQPLFTAGSCGDLFLVVRDPQRDKIGPTALIIPPFCEEMNKSRRSVTELCNRLASSGISSVTVDLFGTGDSHGELVCASYEHWLSDLDTVYRWVLESGRTVHAIVGVRLGCLLAVDWLKRRKVGVPKSVFWNPVDSGRQQIRQMFRAEAMSGLLRKKAAQSVDQMFESIETGTSVRAMGYELPPGLIKPIMELTWSELSKDLFGRTKCLIAGGGEKANQCDSGADEVVSDDAFWMATETVVAESMVAATVRALCESDE